MLVIGRHVGESIYIGDDVRIFITHMRGGYAHIAIEAPRHIKINRSDPKFKNTVQSDSGGSSVGEHSNQPIVTDDLKS